MYRPRSILRLILAGFAVIMTPLIAAVVTAVIQVDRLAEHSRTAVLEAEAATQQSRTLVESLIEMRRAALQFQVTGDADFLDIYMDRRQAFLGAFRGLARSSLTVRASDTLDRIARQEATLFHATRDSRRGATTSAAVGAAEQSWSRLNDLARTVVDESRMFVEGGINQTTARADELQRTLLFQAATVIPSTIFLAALFAILISRPMGELGAAIRRLGAQQLSDTISVQGPRDVEELGMLLDWLRRRIRKLEDQKTTFLRHLSHELKTPLTTIREGSELLAESLPETSPEDVEVSRIIRANSMQLQILIENLLHFSETQDIVHDLALEESIDLRAVVEGVVAAQSLCLNAKSLSVVTDLAPITTCGDENKLRVIVDNLLSNAAKYTPPCGRIKVSLSAAGDRAMLDVEDTGPGIDDADVERIFMPFQRGRTECQSYVKGTGLGLSIAKSCVEAHDGYITVVRSTTGAHLRVSLPISGPARDRTRVAEPDVVIGV